jgi:hypothetical protein
VPPSPGLDRRSTQDVNRTRRSSIMPIAVYCPGARSVADVRRLEVTQLVSAVETLHGEGVIDAQEYRAKRSALTVEPRVLDRGCVG